MPFVKFAPVFALAFALGACASLPKAAGQDPTDNATANQTATWNRAYGGADKSYDARLLALRDEIAPRFAPFAFEDKENGVSLEYSLYIPKNYDPSKKYPLVMFIADASTAGKGRLAPLMQGYGGIIWASDESQAKQPAFVLVPSFKSVAVNDQWHTSDEVASLPRLIADLQNRYALDSRRLYATGQSMGGMIAFYLSSRHPDLFAASMFVGSQWDINVLQPLTKAHFIYTVSAGDAKASAGMKEVIALLAQNQTPFSESEFSARLPQDEQNRIVQSALDQGNRANFIRFTPNTVMPDGVNANSSEHMYSFDRAYLLAPARDWLFAQQKDR